jgi:hypothetical protein
VAKSQLVSSNPLVAIIVHVSAKSIRLGIKS